MKMIFSRSTFIPGFRVFTLQDNDPPQVAPDHHNDHTAQRTVTGNSSLSRDVHARR